MKIKKYIKYILLTLILVACFNQIAVAKVNINSRITARDEYLKKDHSSRYQLFTGNALGSITATFSFDGVSYMLNGKSNDQDRIYQSIDEGRLFAVLPSNSPFFGRTEKVKTKKQYDEYSATLYNPIPMDTWLDNILGYTESEFYTDEIYILNGVKNKGNVKGLMLIIRPYLPYKLNHILIDLNGEEVLEEKIYLEEDKKALHLDDAKIEKIREIEEETGYIVDYEYKKPSVFKLKIDKPDMEFNLYYKKVEELDKDEIDISIRYGHIKDGNFISFKDQDKNDIKTNLILKDDEFIEEDLIEIKEFEGYEFKNIKPSLENGVLAKDLIDKEILVLYEQNDRVEKYSLEVETRNKNNNKLIPNTNFMFKDKSTNEIYDYLTNENGKFIICDLVNGKYKILPSNLEGYKTDNEIIIEIQGKNKIQTIYYTPIKEIKPPTNPENPDESQPDYRPNKPGIPSIPEITKPDNKEKELIEIEDDEIKLNKTDHFKYIQGYEDGTIRPEDNITREEVAAVFFRLLDNDYKEKVRKNTNNFTDLSTDRWSNKHISTLCNADILQGYKDGGFKPEEYITRAEVAAIATRFESLEKCINRFKDTKGHWAEDLIASAAKKGWIKGYEDGKFRPDEYITRAEFVTLVNGVLGRNLDFEGLRNIKKEDVKQYTDLNMGKWYFCQIMEASNCHLYEISEDESNMGIWLEVLDTNREM